MSVEAQGLVFHHSQAPDAEFRVLMAIANYYGTEEVGAWPSVATIAARAHKSERSVQRLIRNLVDLGELAVHEQEGGTHKTRNDRRPNRYELLLRCPPDCDGNLSHKRRSATPSRDDTDDTPSPDHGTTPMTPREGVRGDTDDTPTDPRGVIHGRHGVTHVTPESVKEESVSKELLTPLPPTASPPATAVSRQAQIDSVFQAWRTATGRSDATKLDGKRTALIARQLRLYPVEDLCDAVRGWRHFPHNRGETNGTRYDGLDLCLRDAEHIERFRDAERGTAATPELTGMARIRAMTNAPPSTPQPFGGQVIDVAAS